MKIVGLQQLCRLEGTVVFSQWLENENSGVRRGPHLLCLRGAPIEGDPAEAHRYDGPYDNFYAMMLIPEVKECEDYEDPVGVRFAPVGDWIKWDNFDSTELFVVYEEADLASLRAALNVVSAPQPPYPELAAEPSFGPQSAILYAKKVYERAVTVRGELARKAEAKRAVYRKSADPWVRMAALDGTLMYDRDRRAAVQAVEDARQAYADACLEWVESLLTPQLEVR